MTVRQWRTRDSLDPLGPPATWLEAQGREQIGSAADFTVVAVHDGDLVGVGCAYASRWHPRRLWSYVEVAPDHRRNAHGTALLQALRRRAERPLRGKVTAGSAGAAFARARSLRSIQRCRTLALATADTPKRPDVDADPSVHVAAAAFRAFYATTHHWDPLGDIGPDEFVASHLADAVARFAVRGDDGDVLAIGCLYDEGDALLLSGGPTRPGEHAATETLVAAAARFAARAGRELTAEVDNANESLARATQHYAPVVLDETHIVADS